MILKPDDYTPWGLECGRAITIDMKNAEDFARRILLHLGISLSECDEVLYSTGRHGDPGERLRLEGLWETRDLTRLGLEPEEEVSEKKQRRKRRPSKKSRTTISGSS